jgi:hypothetical protein
MGCALAWMAGRWMRQLGILAVVASLVGGGIGLYDAFTAETRVINEVASRFAGALGAPEAAVRLALHSATRSGQVRISVEFGLFAVIIGAIAGLIAALLALTGRQAGSLVPVADRAMISGWARPAGPASPAPSEPSPDLPDPQRPTQ